MSDSKYRLPTEEEKRQGAGLSGSKIAIWWDGDSMFYPCVVKSYDEKSGKFSVLYEEDNTGEQYEEDLNTSTWKIWAGTEQEYLTERILKVSSVSNPCPCIVPS
jgi:hypothetical protein